jgi:hypothetical protein
MELLGALLPERLWVAQRARMDDVLYIFAHLGY